ncbi:protein DOG1-like 4 [Neltuma alba]|uniref:protein DOG1-like 4 n=1 Tax=Neltuma alba TaxID=207710 RepID=UPI0010A3BC69|nr:protein DOG1-like 4 [Prosopis alba]XP_028802112.1 protein DOG1-like 4 [Prosopis alba]
MAQTPQQQNARSSFQSFFEGWLSRQQSFLDQLLTLSLAPDSPLKMEQQSALIDQVLFHYQQYFQERSRLADDVFLLFSPTWLTSYERALLWIADYKPSLVLHLVDGAVDGLSPEQKAMLERVKDDTRRQERVVTGAMASVQEIPGGPSMLQLARRVGRLIDGEVDELDTALEMLKNAMREVLERADELRVSTSRKVVEILRPSQTVQFLAAAAQFQLGVRSLGKRLDSRFRAGQASSL